MKHPIEVFIEAVIDVARGTKEQTQDDYALAGPAKEGE